MYSQFPRPSLAFDQLIALPQLLDIMAKEHKHSRLGRLVVPRSEPQHIFRHLRSSRGDHDEDKADMEHFVPGGLHNKRLF